VYGMPRLVLWSRPVFCVVPVAALATCLLAPFGLLELERELCCNPCCCSFHDI